MSKIEQATTVDNLIGDWENKYLQDQLGRYLLQLCRKLVLKKKYVPGIPVNHMDISDFLSFESGSPISKNYTCFPYIPEPMNDTQRLVQLTCNCCG